MNKEENLEIKNLNIQIENFQGEIKQLQRKMKNPVIANIIFAATTSVILNSVANMTDHYSLLEFIKYCTLNTIGFLPTGCVISYYVYELNKEKQEKIYEINNQISEAKEKINELKGYKNGFILSNKIITEDNKKLIKKNNSNI